MTSERGIVSENGTVDSRARAGAVTETMPDPETQLEGEAERQSERAEAAWWRRAVRQPGVVASLTWLVTMPFAFAVPGWLDLNPFTQRDADLPLAALFGGTLVLVCVALRRRGPAVIGVTAGLFASYIALVLRTALSGTPFGHEGVYGDTGRLSAMAVRYAVNWASTDGIVDGVASEYPPLFPYLVGKTAMLLDVPAWRLLGPAMVVTVSASVVVGFVLWARLVAPAAALVISTWVLLPFGAPHKAYEVIALAVVVPLALTVVGRPPRGRLHWLPAGLTTGALCLTYYAYVAFAAIGLIVLGWTVWRNASDRRAYLLYLARVTDVVAVVTAWYTVPYVWAMLNGGQQIADTYQHRQISQNPFPFLRPTLVAVVQLGGAAGLLWYGRTMWWARPLLLIIAGCYAYYAIGMLRWVLFGHSGLLYYSMPLISACLLAGAVLSLRELVPTLARRMRRSFVSGSGVVVMSVTLVTGGFAYWTGWMPAKQWIPTEDGGDRVDWDAAKAGNRYAAHAHYQYLPDGSRPRYAELSDPASFTEPIGTWRYLPVTQIQRAVGEVRPRDERPRVLSYDEQLYAFLPWRGYMGVERVASYAPVQWEDRHDAVIALSRIGDPAAFARASSRTAFGPIDVFVLRAESDALVWKAFQVPNAVRFTRAQFATAFVVKDLPDGTVVATRRP